MPTLQRVLPALAFLAFVGLLAFHFAIYSTYNLNWTDGDQTVMWTASVDMSNGNFYQPRFYGQDYGNMAEALFAAPLVALGMEPFEALPVVTHLSVILTVFNLFVFFWKKGDREWAICLVTLSLSFSYYVDLQLSMPRAFFPGIALSSFLVYFANRNTNTTYLIRGLLAMLALSLNLSALFLLTPLLLSQLLKSPFKKRFIVYALAGGIIGLVIHFGIQQYYSVHPEVIVHTYRLRLSLNDFYDSIAMLSETLRGFVPLMDSGGLVTVVLIVLIIVYNVMTKNKSALLISSVFTIILLLSLTSNKAHDGFESVYFSTSRMYLAVPFALLVLIGYSLRKVHPVIPALLFILSGSFAWSKVNSGFEDFHLNGYRMVQVRSMDSLQTECESLLHLCESHNLNFVFFGPDILNYGCSVLETHKLASIKLGKERRSWVWEETQNDRYSKVLFYGNMNAKIKNADIAISQIGEGAYILAGEPRCPRVWAELLGWPPAKNPNKLERY